MNSKFVTQILISHRGMCVCTWIKPASRCVPVGRYRLCRGAGTKRDAHVVINGCCAEGCRGRRRERSVGADANSAPGDLRMRFRVSAGTSRPDLVVSAGPSGLRSVGDEPFFAGLGPRFDSRARPGGPFYGISFASATIDPLCCEAGVAKARKMEAAKQRRKARMSSPDDSRDGSAERNFLAVLPISDDVVTVRAMSDTDAEAYAAGANDALVRHFAHLPLDEYTPQIVRSMMRGAIADGLRDGSLAVLAISDAGSDSFLGSLVIFDVKADGAEIGYWVAPEHRGRKVSGRALRLAMEMARKLGLKRLRARTVQENPASEKVLLDAGFEQVGEARPEIVPSGKTEMSVNYRVEL